MFSLVPSLFLLVWVLMVGACAQELDVSVLVNNNELDVSIEELHDPCDGHKCPSGTKCETVFTPQLMKLPVAHCTTVEMNNNGPCVEYTVNTNLLSCKSLAQWEQVGENQCLLRATQPVRKLTNTEVRFNCQSFHRSVEQKYMTATFTCCSSMTEKPSEQTSGNNNPQKIQNQESVQYTSSQDADTENTEPPTSMESLHIMRFIIPSLLGALALLAMVTLIIVMWQRNKSKTNHQVRKPKLVMATSFVNPSAEHSETSADWIFNPLDTTDKSLLIVNQDPRN